MQVRMIFGTYIQRDEKTVELPAQSTQDLDNKTAFALFADGRAEPTDPTDKAYQAWLSKQPVVSQDPLNA